jgi:hypothetical protein
MTPGGSTTTSKVTKAASAKRRKSWSMTQKSEDRSQKSEDGRQKSEIRNIGQHIVNGERCQ